MIDTRYFNSKGQIFYRASDGTWSDFSRTVIGGFNDRAMSETFGPLTLDGEVEGGGQDSPIGPGRGPHVGGPVATRAQSSGRREGQTRCDRSALCELSGELDEQLGRILVWWKGLSADGRHLVEHLSRKSSKAEYFPNWLQVGALMDTCAAAKASREEA